MFSAYLTSFVVTGKCSCNGDDAINVLERACPTLQACKVTAKRCGVLVAGHSNSKLEDCTISGCGAQACRAMEHASVRMARCVSSCLLIVQTLVTVEGQC